MAMKQRCVCVCVYTRVSTFYLLISRSEVGVPNSSWALQRVSQIDEIYVPLPYRWFIDAYLNNYDLAVFLESYTIYI